MIISQFHITRLGNSTYAPGNDNNFLSRPQGNNYDIGAFEHRNTWTGNYTFWYESSQLAARQKAQETV